MYVIGFYGRHNFFRFLNLRGVSARAEAVEIGTHRGDFAAQFLSGWLGRRLYCIDPWIAGYDPSDPTSSSDRFEDRKKAEERLTPYTEKVTICPQKSEDVVKRFRDISLSFVYVDGCHQPKSVRQDIELYWEKVEIGGILAGHDIICAGEENGGWGRFIQPVVEAFAKKHNLQIHLVFEEMGLPWSYYLIKGKE